MTGLPAGDPYDKSDSCARVGGGGKIYEVTFSSENCLAYAALQIALQLLMVTMSGD